MIRKICAVVLIGIFSLSVCLVSYAQEKQSQDDIYRKLDLFGEALAVIQKKSAEEQTPKDLIYGAISGLLLSLDSYSQFLDPDDYKDLLVETEGKFGGLGIEITIREGLLTIVSPIEDTPAWKAGLKAGDIIVKIEDEITKGITLSEAVKKLRGRSGTKVNLTVLREADRSLMEVTITRAIIKIKDIKRSLILKDSVGYVKLAEFRESTAKDLDKALKGLDSQGMTALMLDLRNNPGGLLDSAAEVASRFLEDNKLIVYTKTREGKEVKFKALSLSKKYLDIPMVVIINKGSASGSEIVAAALRDNKRAILLGETSFGKGSVQTVIPLSDGSAVRLTTAKYYTPNGSSIHDKGIDPDIIVVEDVKRETKEDLFEKIKEERKDFDYKKDYQILRALDLIKGLLVLSSK